MQFKLVVTRIKAKFFDRRLKNVNLPDGILAYIGGKEIFTSSHEFQAGGLREAENHAEEKVLEFMMRCYELGGLRSFKCAYEVHEIKTVFVMRKSWSRNYPDRRKEPGYEGIHRHAI